MEIDFNVIESGDGTGVQYRSTGRPRVLLREPERCIECNKVFLGLYQIKTCAEHYGLDEI